MEIEVVFPEVLMKWLSGLPKADRLRETEIAERNLRRIFNHQAAAADRS